ncbi:anti-sigma factor [Catellatospora aurea]|uniref:Anti-sigma factor n=1 Tax=Catellatospora aurea TaxID=1337874 RepID=A0ABW2H0B0_9ACTN
MRHLDTEQLTLLAFDEPSEQTTAAAHLTSCDTCRDEVAELRRLAGVVAHTRPLRALPPPPPRLWSAIAAQAGLAEAGTGTAAAPPRRTSDAAASPDAGSVPRGPVRPSDNRPPAAAGPARRRRGLAKLVLAAGVIAAVAAGAVAGVWWDRPPQPPAPTVLAAAALTAYGDTPASATGSADVVAGHRLRLHVAGLPAVDGYYEVWLIDPDTMKMFSVGTLGPGADGEFSLPANADLAAYRLVDVSAEHFDNNTAHSGDSLLRGLLT